MKIAGYTLDVWDINDVQAKVDIRLVCIIRATLEFVKLNFIAGFKL